MNPDAEQYLQTYIQQLNNIENEAQVYDVLAPLQFDLMSNGVQANAVNAINNELQFQSPAQNLQANHPPTTVIGRLDGLVIVSANPGYHPERNLLESLHRKLSPEINANFCRYFFQHYPSVVAAPPVIEGHAPRRRTAPYWTKALNLYQRAFRPGLPHITPSLQLWGTAAGLIEAPEPDNWALGGADLFPFHSTSDGITCRMARPHAERTLRDVGTATLSMLLRLPAPTHGRFARRLLLVSSRAGAELVENLGHGLLTPWEPVGDQAWKMYLAHSTLGASATSVLRIPYQVFSQGYPRGWCRDTFAGVVLDAVKS